MLIGSHFLLGSFNQRDILVQTDVANEVCVVEPKIVCTSNLLIICLLQVLQIKAFDADTCEPIVELSNTLDYPSFYGRPELKTFDCKQKRNNDGKSCLFILSTVDEAILGIQQNKLRWVREEALANIVATEFIDLPLADSEGALENEMKGKSGKQVKTIQNLFKIININTIK